MIITLFPDIYKRAPRTCVRCENHEVEWGDTCIDCYLDLQEEKQERRQEDEIHETQD